jgi:hypothetical protein
MKLAILRCSCVDLALLSGNLVRVPLPLPQLAGQFHLVYVFSASIIAPYVAANLRTPTKVEQAITARSPVNRDGSYVAPATVGIDGLSLTPSKTKLLEEVLLNRADTFNMEGN